MSKFLITGASGYLGNQLSHDLVYEGHEVMGFDQDMRQGIVPQNIRFVNYSLSDFDHLHEPFWSAFKFDGVFHLAAKAVVQESFQQPDVYYHSNVSGTISLLKSMRRAKVDVPVVFASSCAIYGDCDFGKTLKEEDDKWLNSPYAHSKRMCEQILSDFADSYKTPFAAMRIFNIVGADPLGRCGDMNWSGTRLLPNILECRRLKKPLTVCGQNSIRDYVHVKDVSDALMRAMDYLRTGGRMQTFNVCTGVGTSVTEMVAAVDHRIIGESTEIRAGDDLKEPSYVVGNNDFAKSILGWSPKYSLDDAIHHADGFHYGKRMDILGIE